MPSGISTTEPRSSRKCGAMGAVELLLGPHGHSLNSLPGAPGLIYRKGSGFARRRTGKVPAETAAEGVEDAGKQTVIGWIEEPQRE
jgi:hypothetical protein